MSYVVDIIVPLVPAAESESQHFLSALYHRFDRDQQGASPILAKLHQLLTSAFPCLSSYAHDDPAIDQCPWSDGPLIDNFGSEMGRVGISARVEEVMAYLVKCAGQLGLTVLDQQDGTIYRPPMIAATTTYRVAIQGMREGQDSDKVIDALVPLFKGSREQVAAMMAKLPLVVKKDVDLATATKYKEALKQRGCEVLVSPMPRSTPAAPAATPAVTAVPQRYPSSAVSTFPTIIAPEAPPDAQAPLPRAADPAVPVAPTPATVSAQPAPPVAGDWQLQPVYSAAQQATVDYSKILLARHLVRGLGVSLNVPASWEEQAGHPFTLIDKRASAKLAVAGSERADLSLWQFMEMQTEQVARESPHLVRKGNPYPMHGRNWEQRVQAVAAEFQGRAAGNAEDTHVLLVCLHSGDSRITLTITSTAPVYAQNAGFYRWLLLNQLDVQKAEAAQAPEPPPARAAARRIAQEPKQLEWADDSIQALAKGKQALIYFVLFFAQSIAIQMILPVDLPRWQTNAFGGLGAGLLLRSTWFLTKGLGTSGLMRLLLLILFFVPPTMLVLPFMLNWRASRRLKEEGYEVGWLGVKGGSLFRTIFVWINIAILALLIFTYWGVHRLGLHAPAHRTAIQARQTQLADDPNPCPLVATWNAEREGAPFTVTLQDDGSFVSRPVSHDLNPGPATRGSWKMNGDTILWTYDSGPVGPASNTVRVDGPGHLTLSGSGPDASYAFANTIDSARCKN